MGSGADERRSRHPSGARFLVARRLVGHDDDARTQRRGADQPHTPGLARVPEEALPAPHDDGVNHQPVLVDEVVPHQRAHKIGAAEDEDIVAVLPLEPGDPFGDVTLDEG